MGRSLFSGFYPLMCDPTEDLILVLTAMLLYIIRLLTCESEDVACSNNCISYQL